MEGITPDSSFYTLSSNQPSQLVEKDPEYAHDLNSSILAFPLATHDTSRSNCHMKSLSRFVEALDQTAKRAFPNLTRSYSRYQSVQVLLLRWADDHLNVEPEVADLSRVFESYGFHTTSWLIPTENSHRRLMLKVGEFVDAYDRKDCLMIVYYAGHAYINEARQSTWSCTRSRSVSTLDWSAIQTLFESATSDVLLLLDCCAAASSAPKGGKTMTEIIAACGWESIAPEPGRFSFTSALIEVLEEWINRRYSVAMLHSQILSVLKHERPERLGGPRRIHECRTTPVYIVTTEDPTIPSIVLSRIRAISPAIGSSGSQKRGREEDPPPNKQYASSQRRSKQAKHHSDKDQLYSHVGDLDDMLVSSTGSHDLEGAIDSSQLPSPPKECGASGEKLLDKNPDGLLKVPHVLISIALEEDQVLDAEASSAWLASFPALAQYAKVQSIYRSYSTLMIMSIPVVLWNMLPDDSACRFIGYVRSGDILSKDVLGKEVSMIEQVKDVPRFAALDATPAIENIIDTRKRIQSPRQISISRSPSVASVRIRRSLTPLTGNSQLFQASSTAFTNSVIQKATSPQILSTADGDSSFGPPAKKSRTNTPWTLAEEQRVKTMRETGNSWADIAKTFPSRTEGSIKKHWYKDMHHAEFAEDEAQALLNAIKDYETNKWKEIGKKVGKPAKACEQHAKERFAGKI